MNKYEKRYKKQYNKEMLKHKRNFKELGFNIESKGCEYFIDVVDWIKKENDELKSKNKEELTEEELKENIPSYCLEIYHFDRECGRISFYKEILKFLNKEAERPEESFDEYVVRAENIISNAAIGYYNLYVKHNDDLQNNINKTKVKK